MIINHDTGECRLEKLSSNITVKKTRVEGSSKIQYRVDHHQQQIRNSSKTPNLTKLSPPEDEVSPESSMDDIEKELKAEASVVEQMSSCESSSDSKVHHLPAVRIVLVTQKMKSADRLLLTQGLCLRTSHHVYHATVQKSRY